MTDDEFTPPTQDQIDAAVPGPFRGRPWERLPAPIQLKVLAALTAEG